MPICPVPKPLAAGKSLDTCNGYIELFSLIFIAYSFQWYNIDNKELSGKALNFSIFEIHHTFKVLKPPISV